jgi:hypothetical protein
MRARNVVIGLRGGGPPPVSSGGVSHPARTASASSASASSELQQAEAEFASMPPDVQAYVKAVGLTRMPSFVKWLAASHAHVAGELEAVGDSTTRALSPDQINDMIAEHRAKNSAALMDKTHPDHASAVNELTRLFNLLHPPAE